MGPTQASEAVCEISAVCVCVCVYDTREAYVLLRTMTTGHQLVTELPLS